MTTLSSDLARVSRCTPQRTADPLEALALVRRDGAAILTDSGGGRDDARGIALRVLASLNPMVPDPALIKEGGDNADKSQPPAFVVDSYTVPFNTGHTDGFGYGDGYPDFIFLLCVRASEHGGESFVVDTYALLDALRDSSNAGERAFHTFLTEVPVEQTGPEFIRALSPVVINSGSGRRMTRRSGVQRAIKESSPEERAYQTEQIACWAKLAHEASLHAPRFTLQPGEAICLDNYRMLHGRTGFDDVERTLWRIWAWTQEALYIPYGLLFSDSRYAVKS